MIEELKELHKNAYVQILIFQFQLCVVTKDGKEFLELM